MQKLEGTDYRTLGMSMRGYEVFGIQKSMIQNSAGYGVQGLANEANAVLILCGWRFCSRAHKT